MPAIAERVRAGPGAGQERRESSWAVRAIEPGAGAPAKAALAKPSRPGVRKIAEQFGISPGTVQRISRPLEARPAA